MKIKPYSLQKHSTKKIRNKYIYIYVLITIHFRFIRWEKNMAIFFSPSVLMSFANGLANGKTMLIFELIFSLYFF